MLDSVALESQSLLKDINGMDLKEAEDITKRQEQYTEELYEKKSS